MLISVLTNYGTLILMVSGLCFGGPKPVFPKAVGKTWEKLFSPGFGQYLLPKTGGKPDLLYDVAFR